MRKSLLLLVGLLTAILTLAVRANTPPVANDDYFYVFPGQSLGPLDVLGNDTDADGDPLSILSATGATISGQNLIYTGPLSTQPGTAASYAITDGHGPSGQAQAYVQLLRLETLSHVGPESVTVACSLAASQFRTVPASYFVEYGTTQDYTASTPVQPKTLSSVDGRMEATLADLQPGTQYFYRFSFTADGRTIRSGSLSFTTPQRPFGMVSLFGSEAHLPERRLIAFEAGGSQRTLATGIGGGPLVHGGDGALYVSDAAAGKIHRVTADGQLSVHADNLVKPTGLVLARDGTIYVAVDNGSASKIVAIALDGTRRDFVPIVAQVAELAVASDGNLYASPAAAGLTITRIDPTGNATRFSGLVSVNLSICTMPDNYVVAGAFTSVTRFAPSGTAVSSSHVSQDILGVAANRNYAGNSPFSIFASFTSGAIRTVEFDTTSDFALSPNAVAHLAAPAVSSAETLPVETYSTTAALLRGSFTTAGRKVSTRFAWREGSAGAVQYTPAVEYDPALGSREATAPIAGLKAGKRYNFWLIVEEPEQPTVQSITSTLRTFDTSATDGYAVADRFHFSLSAAPFTLDVLANDVVPATNPTTLVSVTNPLHGTVRIEDGKVIYTPHPAGVIANTQSTYVPFDEAGFAPNSGVIVALEDYHGNDSFSYTAADAFGTMTTATVEIVNYAPQVADAAFAVARGETLKQADFLDGARDLDGDPPTITAAVQPQHGQLTVTARGFTYTPNESYLAGDEFTLRVDDGAGLSALVKVGVYLPETVVDVTAARGGQVSQMAQGVTYASFGVPAINDAGAVVFTATLRGLVKNKTGVFVARAGQAAGAIGAPVKVALAGEDAPGVEHGKFVSVGEPVISALGRVTFTARARVGARTVAGIWTDANGSLSAVAVAGQPAGVTPAATFADFTGVAVGSAGRAIFTAKLAAPAGRDTGLWVEQGDGTLKCVLQEGDTIHVAAGDRAVKSVAIFGALAGTPDARRGYDGFGDLVVRASLVPTGEALLRGGPTGGWTVIAEASGPGTLGLGTVSTYASGKTGVTSVGLQRGGPAYFKAGSAIQAQTFSNFLSGTSSVRTIAEVGSIALGVPGANNIRYTALGDPVGDDYGAVAFLGTLQVAGPIVPAEKNGGIWFAEAGDFPRLLVQEGDYATGIPGAKLTAFKSLALPGARGVAFTGVASFPKPQSIPPRPAPAPVTGFWAQDRTGEFQLLLRTGAALPGTGSVAKKVREFTVFSAVPGAAGGRSANATGGFVARVTYEDQSQAIVTVWVP